jgi:HlyD family secretion protein
MNKILVTLIIGAAMTAAALIAPEFIKPAVQTAKPVKVQKVEHTDSVEADGGIIRDSATGLTTVVAYVGEEDISYVKVGQKAEITGNGFPDVTYAGTVAEIAEQAEIQRVGSAQAIAVEVKIEVNSPDEKLKTGFSANVRILTSESRLKTIVPYEAVNQDDGGEYLYILKNGTAEKRYILTGTELSDGIEIIEGIADGETVITPLSEDFDGGMPVSVE